eukprot:13690508-Alexandrium_andersonii.AAC.1
MGGIITSGGEPGPEIKARVAASRSTVSMIRKPVLAAPMFPVPTRLSLLDSLAITRLLYNVHALG